MPKEPPTYFWYNIQTFAFESNRYWIIIYIFRHFIYNITKHHKTAVLLNNEILFNSALPLCSLSFRRHKVNVSAAWAAIETFRRLYLLGKSG